MKVRFYMSASGRSPVEDYLRRLPARDAAPVIASIKAIETHGLEGAGVTTRHIEGKLWEIKVSAQRVFYVVISGPEMVLLHAYKKQSQKAPKTEIETAQRRLKEILED